MFRWFIIINLLAALFLSIAAPAPVRAKRAQANAMYEELKREGVLVERAGYDAEGKLRTLAGDNEQMILGFHVAAVICLANAFALYLVERKFRK